MTQIAGETRQFRVHARHVDGHQARLLEEASFEAAAVAYLEDFHPPMTDGHAISVIVREVQTGHEHCFRIDLGSGEVAAGREPFETLCTLRANDSGEDSLRLSSSPPGGV